MSTIKARLGSVTYSVRVDDVNHRRYHGDPDDRRSHTVEMTINLDRLLDQLAARACKSSRGRSTGMSRAIVVRRKA